MAFRPIETMISMQREYPDIVELHFPNNYTMFFVSNPELIEEILVTKQKSFHKDAFLKVYAQAVFGNGLLSSDGEFWLRQRRMAQPAFHRQRIEAYGDIIAHHTEQFLRRCPVGMPFNFTKEMMQLTLDIVAETLFGDVKPNQKQTINESLEAIMNQFSNDGLDLISQITKLPLTKQRNQRYNEATAKLDVIIKEIITERLQSPVERNDLLGMLLAARDDDNQPMNMQQLVDECKTMFLAGHETTALTMTWTMRILHKHPTVLHTLRQEIDSVLGGRTATMSDMMHLEYTEKIIRESMRLFPPAYTISRHSTDAVQIGDYHIPANKDINLSQIAVQRDPRWYEKPEAFVPERWSHDFRSSLPKYAYFPFGGGPRLCIGQQFALLETTVILTRMLQYGEWSLSSWQRITAQPSITLRPKQPVMMTLRNSSSSSDGIYTSPHDSRDDSVDGGEGGGD